MAFILATPHSSDLRSPGVPVRRAPTSSLNSVRNWNACELSNPSPAIFTSAGFVPSSSGPFGAGFSFAHNVCAPPRHAPTAKTAAPPKTGHIPISPCATTAHKNSTTLSDAAAANPFHGAVPALVNTAILLHQWLYRIPPTPYTALGDTLRSRSVIPICSSLAIFLLLPLCGHVAWGQEAPQKAQEKAVGKSAEKSSVTGSAEIPAQIELLETRIRFETNGDSRKEVHARVHIHNELGVRQFARLNFDYNRSFESIELPLVRITHPRGGTADILPSAITDNPNPAVVNAPAYQDVRVKTVRILGLEPGDLLEYRVITTVSHHPLAPDFWLDHSFDRTGVVSHEIFELDLPTSPKIRLSVNPMTPANWTEKSGEGDGVRTIYRWDVATTEAGDENAESDVAVTTFTSWLALLAKLRQRLEPKAESAGEIEKKAAELTAKLSTAEQKLRAVYDFVSQKIAGIDLPLGATGFQTRAPAEILASSHATAEDKFV